MSTSLWLIRSDDVPDTLIDAVAAALEDGGYRDATQDDMSRSVLNIRNLVRLLPVDEKADLPAIAFGDPRWYRPPGTRSEIQDQGMTEIPDAHAMALRCLRAPRLDKKALATIRPILKVMAASACDATCSVVGASTASPWHEAVAYETKSLIGSVATPVEHDAEASKTLPRLVKLGRARSAPRPSGSPDDAILLTPMGLRQDVRSLPTPLECMRMLREWKTSHASWKDEAEGGPALVSREDDRRP
jgi:hypothetical protein